MPDSPANLFWTRVILDGKLDPFIEATREIAEIVKMAVAEAS